MFEAYTNSSRLSAKEIARLLNRPPRWVYNRLGSTDRTSALVLPPHDSETVKRNTYGTKTVYLWKFTTVKQFILENRK